MFFWKMGFGDLCTSCALVYRSVRVALEMFLSLFGGIVVNAERYVVVFTALTTWRVPTSVALWSGLKQTQHSSCLIVILRFAGEDTKFLRRLDSWFFELQSNICWDRTYLLVVLINFYRKLVTMIWTGFVGVHAMLDDALLLLCGFALRLSEVIHCFLLLSYGISGCE